MNEETLIEVSNLTKSYSAGGRILKAVDNASFSIKRSRMVSVIGHSGSGKTTLLSLIGGLTKPDSGLIMIDGVSIWSMSDNAMSEFRNKKISFIYQFSSLIPTLTSLENIILPTAFGDYGDKTSEYAMELLDTVGLKDKADIYPSQLSGGQQRRVAIARAFINNPDIVLADEPTGDLDEETEAEIVNFFKLMNREKGVTFVIATHNNDLAQQTGRQLKMRGGLIQEL